MKKNNNLAWISQRQLSSFSGFNFTFVIPFIVIFGLVFAQFSVALADGHGNMAANDSPKLNPQHPQSYTVVKGDTLWDISAKFLQNPWQWPDIWQGNPHIKNPHLIYPGDILDLVYVEGKPKIVRRQGGRPVYKLSPKTRHVALDQSIPTIPLEKIAPFLSGNIIVARDTLKNAPYVVAAAEGRVIAGSQMQIYVNNVAQDTSNNHWGLYRKGNVYRNPFSPSEVLGFEAIYLGDAFLDFIGKPSTFTIKSSKAEILKGHRLIPLNNKDFDKNFMPKAASTKKSARIISSLTAGLESGVKNIAAFDVVVISIGKKDGIDAGDVFDIYRRGAIISDPLNQRKRVKLPDEIAGNLLVFRSFDKLSYAIVMDATQVLNKGDVVRSPYLRAKGR